MSNALTTLTHKLASRLGMDDGAELVETLKATAFNCQVTDAQMTALMSGRRFVTVVSDENTVSVVPAYVDKSGEWVPLTLREMLCVWVPVWLAVIVLCAAAGAVFVWDGCVDLISCLGV